MGKENYNGWLRKGGRERFLEQTEGAAWRREQVGQVFDILDADNSGQIGWEELMRLGEVRRRNYHKVFAEYRGQWSKDMCLHLLSKMEPKGGNGNIDRLEFAQLFVGRLPFNQEKFELTVTQFKEALLAEERERSDEETTIADGLSPRGELSP